jgi:hypothetical protein
MNFELHDISIVYRARKVKWAIKKH